MKGYMPGISNFIDFNEKSIEARELILLLKTQISAIEQRNQ